MIKLGIGKFLAKIGLSYYVELLQNENEHISFYDSLLLQRAKKVLNFVWWTVYPLRKILRNVSWEISDSQDTLIYYCLYGQ